MRGLCVLYCYPFTSQLTWISTCFVRCTRAGEMTDHCCLCIFFLGLQQWKNNTSPEYVDTFAIHVSHVLTLGEGGGLVFLLFLFLLASIQKQPHSVQKEKQNSRVVNQSGLFPSLKNTSSWCPEQPIVTMWFTLHYSFNWFPFIFDFSLYCVAFICLHCNQGVRGFFYVIVLFLFVLPDTLSCIFIFLFSCAWRTVGWAPRLSTCPVYRVLWPALINLIDWAKWQVCLAVFWDVSDHLVYLNPNGGM